MICAMCVMLLLARVQAGRSDHPTKKNWKYNLEDCTPKINTNLCTDCIMLQDNVDPKDGKFWNLTRVFDIESLQCQQSIQQYIVDNPCDQVVAECFTKWQNEQDEVCRQRLDRLMWTNCELCCDCIPLNAQPGDYSLTVSRPNCAQHLHFDNCQYYPHMYHDICKINNKRWSNRDYLNQVYDFLWDRMEEFNCSSKPLWDVCYIMEKGQGNLN
eukprot:TRINITY_DN7831_c0_g1_i1.p2 TRINITY_DN7831_c0_g1~~TRINITY_DN7831_c0_g1_i1.p2  ORF type:complete len:213 (-),score=7.49 TRINITY_DN7831_c0_g1_i1:691-1329(-)